MLEILDLTLKYLRQSEPLFANLSFAACPGQLVLLRGPNGSGKTSLLNCLSGVIPQRIKAELAGKIQFRDQDLITLPLNERFRWLTYQMANPDNQIFFPRLRRELTFSLENAGFPAEEIWNRVDAATALFGLERLAGREPSTLSRGEKKLLVLASCCALKPALYLLDEPLAALDSNARHRVLMWLQGELGRGATVIAAGHDSSLADLATRFLDFPQ